jgi:hypothetical protein
MKVMLGRKMELAHECVVKLELDVHEVVERQIQTEEWVGIE